MYKKFCGGRVQCVYETLDQPEEHEGLKRHGIGDQEIEYLSNIMTFMQTESLWHMIGRPYYNLYPIVYDHMIKGIDLRTIHGQTLQPLSPRYRSFH